MCPGWQNHGVVAPRGTVCVTMSRPCSAFSFAENQETKGLLLSSYAAAHVKAEDKLLHVGFTIWYGSMQVGSSTPGGARPKAGKDCKPPGGR